jgi:hypothetical protein
MMAEKHSDEDDYQRVDNLKAYISVVESIPIVFRQPKRAAIGKSKSSKSPMKMLAVVTKMSKADEVKFTNVVALRARKKTGALDPEIKAIG